MYVVTRVQIPQINPHISFSDDFCVVSTLSLRWSLVDDSKDILLSLK
jgi:hypothetical protein